MILAASICIVTAIVASVIFLSTYRSAYYYGWNERGYYMPRYEDLLAGTVGIPAFIYGLAAGILALKRRKFVHCLAGGLLTVFEGLIVFAFAQQWSGSWIIGTLFGVPIIVLSAPALLFVSLSKEEFK
jgi:hypothetical protein